MFKSYSKQILVSGSNGNFGRLKHKKNGTDKQKKFKIQG